MLVKQQLVGGLEPWNFMTFHSVGNVILPTVTQSIIFQRARAKKHQPAMDFSQRSETQR
jgi:hypothetical protein